MAYTARRIPEISDKPADVDRAMMWGFGWTYGPFKTWDILGLERVIQDAEAAGEPMPEWVKEMPSKEAKSFYLGFGPEQKSYVYGEGYQNDPPPADEIPLAYFPAPEGPGHLAEPGHHAGGHGRRRGPVGVPLPREHPGPQRH